jgi:hypothetical protein
MPFDSDVASAVVGFAFDPNDASYPAGQTCEQDLGTLVRDGDLLRFTSLSTCAADPNTLPSVTQTTIACSAQWDVRGEMDVTNVAQRVVGQFSSSASLGSCDVIANGAPVSCALSPNVGGTLSNVSVQRIASGRCPATA